MTCEVEPEGVGLFYRFRLVPQLGDVVPKLRVGPWDLDLRGVPA
jgi:hypothetical protein